MMCDTCNRRMDYAFYINDEHWRKVVGDENFVKSVGRLCAHCALEKLGGNSWYIIFNEPRDNIRRALDEEHASEATRPTLEVAEEPEHVAWMRYVNHGQYEDSGADIITIEVCDSDTKGAFKVYRAPQLEAQEFQRAMTQAAREIRRLEKLCMSQMGKGVNAGLEAAAKVAERDSILSWVGGSTGNAKGTANNIARVIRALITDPVAAATVPEASGWRPIAEAPKDMTLMLCYLDDEGMAVMYGVAADDYHGSKATHFMPLPSPPED